MRKSRLDRKAICLKTQRKCTPDAGLDLESHVSVQCYEMPLGFFQMCHSCLKAPSSALRPGRKEPHSGLNTVGGPALVLTPLSPPSPEGQVSTGLGGYNHPSPRPPAGTSPDDPEPPAKARENSSKVHPQEMVTSLQLRISVTSLQLWRFLMENREGAGGLGGWGAGAQKPAYPAYPPANADFRGFQNPTLELGSPGQYVAVCPREETETDHTE